MNEIKTWLTKHTLFMNEVNFLAQIGHFLFGLASIINVAYIFSVKSALIVAAIEIIAAAFKEFVFDANIEYPPQTWKDNLLDFSMYTLGILTALGIILLKVKVLH